jgi:homoserine kinase type II
MDQVFILHHVRADDEHSDDAKLIGAYRTLANAEAAIARLSLQSGFRDHPDGFHAEPYELDKDHWTEGFVTILPGEE